MRRPPKRGFLLVARRELRWLLHDRVALILIFGVPLFAFAVLTAVFSHPVIRGLGVAVVDEDRSDTSRALVEQLAAAPGLSIVERAADLATAARAIRSGDAIAAVYIPPNLDRDLKAERRPQVVAFYNQQFLTAAGIASQGLGDTLAAAARSVASFNRRSDCRRAIRYAVASRAKTSDGECTLRYFRQLNAAHDVVGRRPRIDSGIRKWNRSQIRCRAGSERVLQECATRNTKFRILAHNSSVSAPSRTGDADATLDLRLGPRTVVPALVASA